MELHGLHVSPDVDALLYTLGGLDRRRARMGGSRRHATRPTRCSTLRPPAWFTVGDADLATHSSAPDASREGDA